MTTASPQIDRAAVPAPSELGPLLAGGLAEARGSADPGRPGSIRVGIDVLPVAEVAESLAAHGPRYLARVFTGHELACCRASAGPGYAPEALAARFAAKEAVLKVLRPLGPRPEWRSIEVRRTGAGWCEIRLAGRAAALAEQASVRDVAVSLSHEAGVAAAVAAAWVGQSTGARNGGEE